METQYIERYTKEYNGKPSESPQMAELTKSSEDLEEKTLEFLDRSPKWEP